MAWRVLALKKFVGASPESLVGKPVREVHPRVAFALVVGGAVGAALLAALLRRRKPHRVDNATAGVCGAGLGAALVFLRTHGIGGVGTLALAIALPWAWVRRGGSKKARRDGPRPRSAAPLRGAPAARGRAADAAYRTSPRFVSPPPLALGQVTRYAPPRAPLNRYTPPLLPPRRARSPERAPAEAASLATPLRGTATASDLTASGGAAECAAEFSVGWAQLPGLKNEDTMTVARNKTLQYVGLFDGHRGRAVASWLADELHGRLTSALAHLPPHARATRGAEVLSSAFEGANRELRQAVDSGGSTALVLCAVDGADGPEGGRGLWVANCGDTRAVLFGREERPAIRLSLDHTPDAPGEKERVESVGGLIEFNCLDGVLEVCRGFGNYDLDGMTAAPHVARVDSAWERLAEQGPDAYVLLASDGLWDVVSDDEAARLCRQQLREVELLDDAAVEAAVADGAGQLARDFAAVRGGAGGASRLSAACIALAREAARLGSKDDITVALVRLLQAEWPTVARAAVSGAWAEHPPRSAQRPPAPAPAAATPVASTPAAAAATPSTTVRVLSGQRGGEHTDEFDGDEVTLCGVPDLASLTSTASQRWDWAGRATYEVSLRPSDAGGGGAAGPEWLAEMYVKGEGYVLRGRLSVQGQKLTLTRTEVPNGPFPSGDGEVHNQVRLVMIVAKAKEGASGATPARKRLFG